MEGKAKAADYAFRVGDKMIFFVEAKKPSVDIEKKAEHAFQVRRYGWWAKLAVSILTDFEQLAVYECSTRPKKTDKASVGRVKLYHYSEYIEKWDEIAAVFSHEVKNMLELHRRQASAKTPGEKEMLARQIAATDKSIDGLVYELPPAGMIYGLTEEEIEIVEG